MAKLAAILALLLLSGFTQAALVTYSNLDKILFDSATGEATGSLSFQFSLDSQSLSAIFY